MELPDILKVGVLKRPVNQSCETTILQPTTFSESQCKFVLENQGILDSNSQLHLAQIVVNSNAATTETNSFNISNVGAAACIRNARLTIGGKEVSNLQEVGNYFTWKRLHYSNEYRKGVAMPKMGGDDVFMGSAGIVDGTPSADAIRRRGFLPPSGTIGRESSEYAVQDTTALASYGSQRTAATQYETAPKRLISYDPLKTPAFTLTLGTIIPALQGIQLPLFAIREEVAIIIEWAPRTWGHRFQFNPFDAAGNAVNKTLLTSSMVEDQTFLILDTLYYPDLMADVKEQIDSRGGFSVGFEDVITQENYVKYTESNGTETHDFQLPLAQKRVKRVIVQKAQELDAATEALPMARYNSEALRLGEEYNFKVDSQNVYSLPLKNMGLIRNEADNSEGVPLVVNQALFCFDNQADATGNIPADIDYNITRRVAMNHIQYNEAGYSFWKALSLTNAFGQGYLMSNQPMVYTEKTQLTQYDTGTGAPGARTSERSVRFFVVYQKVMNINSGLVEVIS